jgi:superfamily I DNA/RNA helicase
LVTAGAGAGKTEFLAQKAAYLLQTGICSEPQRILAISFKRDAARNLEERVQKRCAWEQARRFDSFTFDGFTKNLLDRFRLAIPAPFSPPADYQIVFPTRKDYEMFLDNHGKHGADRAAFEKAIATKGLPIDENSGAGPALLSKYWHSQYEDYDQVLLSFPMINRLVEWLLRENPSIRRALNSTYPYLFLDEFQDTTRAQYHLLQTAFSGSHAVFTAVGDDKQRVMVWAGAMPDSFKRFEAEYNARRIHLLANWRSHEELVRIQHAIATRIDPHVEYPEARAKREVDGDVASIWEFDNPDEEHATLAAWIAAEIQSGRVSPHDVAILVRMHANHVEKELAAEFANYGVKLRNLARSVGDISIQDLLGEDLTALLLPLFRLGTARTSPSHWNSVFRSMQFIERINGYDDDVRLQKLQRRLQDIVRQMRRAMSKSAPDAEVAATMVQATLDFIGAASIRQAFPGYQRLPDFERVRNGFEILLRECADRAPDWVEVLDRFEGIGQVALMTIHKSKGLEFHTMIFYGLDDQSWRSLTPENTEELNAFFVAFTRAKQRAVFTLCTSRGQPVSWIEELLSSVEVYRVDGMTILQP